jgi:FSR family fosmidomycin resistance protein-like MFS transporter
MTQLKPRWSILIMFMLAHAINDGFGWVLPPLLPAVREHFNLSYTEMGAFLTLFRFFGSVMQAPASYLVHFAPVAMVLVGGLFWSSVGMLIASLSTSYAMLVWISAISGIGRATYHPLAVTVLSRTFARERFGRVMGLHLSASNAAQVLAPFLVALLLQQYGWRLPIQVWSLMGLLAGIFLFFSLQRQKADFLTSKKKLGWPFFSKSVGIYLSAISLFSITQSGIMTFLPLFLVDHRRFSVEEAAAMFGLMALSGTICRPFLGALMDRMGRRKPVITAGFISAGLGILGLAGVDNPFLLYPCLVVVGIFGSGHSGLSDTFMVEMIPSHRREETLGFIYTLRMGIASLSPLVVGIFSEQIGLIFVFLVLGFLCLSCALILGFVKEDSPLQP